MSERIGFYICQCGINIASKVRCGDVAAHIARLPNVAVSREYVFMCSDPGQEILERDIRDLGLTRVVVASCSPRMHENTFRAATARAGLNPYRAFHHVCVREHVSWVHLDEDQATHKAKVLSCAGVQRVAGQERLLPATFPVHKTALVVGGGIAGMQASLDIASAGHRVFLVEQSPTLGGHMLQYDKTFPTLDCAACIGTPKMVSVGQHRNIDLFTHAQVEGVSGFVGNYKVRIRKRARFVDPSKCTGCGDCTSRCPVTKMSEWDVGTRLRHAIYRPFPQAVPSSFLIDKVDRAPCGSTCPAGTNVQGYLALVKQGEYLRALQLIMERLPFPGSLGRICPAPCEDSCRRREVDQAVAIREIKRFAADQVDWNTLPLPDIQPKPPDQRVAILGAGPAGLSAAYFLARLGYPVTVFEALPVAGGLMRTGIPDYRLPPQVLDQEIHYLERLGVSLRLSHPIGVETTVDDLFSDGYRAVFAAVGNHRSLPLPIEGVQAQGVLPAIEFLRKVSLGSPVELGDRVIVIGGGAVAMDAARTAVRLGADEVHVFCLEQRETMPAWVQEVDAALQEGIQIHGGWGPQRILEHKGRVKGIQLHRCLRVFDEKGRFAPVYDESDRIDEDCDTLLVAIGQAPDTSWTRGSQSVPLDARGYVIADPHTFATTTPGLFAGGELLTGPSIVVQAVANGREAALSMDRYLRGETLQPVQEAPTSGTWSPIPSDPVPDPRVKTPLIPVAERIGFTEVERGLDEPQARQEANRCIACGSCSECMLCVDACKAQAIDHRQKDEVVEVDVGAIIVATGFEAMDPTPLGHLGYGKLPNVVTNMEFERLCNATGPTGGRILLRDLKDPKQVGGTPGRVAIVHCVGSRDKQHHVYCSRTCCMAALKYAHLIKDRVGHEVEVYNFYIDMRCFGKGYEEFLLRTQAEGVCMIRGRVSRVRASQDPSEPPGTLEVVAEDTLAQRLLNVPVDLVILCTAMEPRKDAQHVARLFGIATGNDGFFLEEHPKLEPVSTATAGIFIAGGCQGPKDIPDAVAQAKAAASMAQSLLSSGKVEVSPITSTIDPDICSGCGVCADLCPYGSIHLDTQRQVSEVNPALCKGCGSCSAHCPSGAAKVGHFRDNQLFLELEGLLASEGVP